MAFRTAVLSLAIVAALSLCVLGEKIPDAAAVLVNKTWPANSVFSEQGQHITLHAELTELRLNVSTSSNSSVVFDLFLPKDWNGRFMTVGNSGFSSLIDYASMEMLSREGFAVAGTNTGHDTPGLTDGAFALDNKNKLHDWGWRAIHVTTAIAKNLTRDHYGKDISYAYFSGASTGGRQGLKEVQISPSSFDGILVSAPAWWASHLYPWIMKISLMNVHGTKGFVDPSLFPKIHAEALNQCDGLDGLWDGVIDPDLCEFQPQALQCVPGQDESECLTSEQVANIAQWYAPYYECNTEFVSGSLIPGSEDSFIVYMNRMAGDGGSFGDDYFKYYVYDNPAWDPYRYNCSDYMNVLARDPGNATAEDYGAVLDYAAKGGKIIMLHGTYDAFIPYTHALQFYDKMLEQVGGNATALGQFFKYYNVPGMSHIFGGAAPWYVASSQQFLALKDMSTTGFEAEPKFNALKSLMHWVEHGTVPEELVATKYVGDSVASGIAAQRPLCAHPAKAYYTSGEFERYESYECR